MSKQTIKGVVVKTWATDGFSAGLPAYKMRIRTESGAEYIATIIESIMNAAPIASKGRTYGLLGATVEVTGAVSGHAISRPRGRVIALTPAMAAQFTIEQQRDAEIKAGWLQSQADLAAALAEEARRFECEKV
ncbi:MAG: hypothetical protein E6Q97_35455 [Desulfurellales bacterium]|nr:MAG: hypothetical protein E6Q97_35455 [Desulfurellales bacterium]